MRRFSVLAVVAFMVLLAARPASAATAAGGWSASHRNGSASGTARFEPSGMFGGTLVIDGVQRSGDSGCYYTRLVVSHDLAPWWYNSEQVCANSSGPVSIRAGISNITWSASITVCRVAATLDCGVYQPVRVS